MPKNAALPLPDYAGRSPIGMAVNAARQVAPVVQSQMQPSRNLIGTVAQGANQMIQQPVNPQVRQQKMIMALRGRSPVAGGDF